MKNTSFSLKSRSAILVGKTISLLTRILKIGGGTAAPGLYALKIDKNLLSSFAEKFAKGSIVITGTNGKTTTTRIISHYFSQNKISYLHNRAGSNLERGMISACLENTSFLGELTPTDYGLWEIDEAEFSRSLQKIQPHTVVLLNLFRDQLDRYGEVDTTRRKWEAAMQFLPSSACIIFNSDDPQLIELTETLRKNRADLRFLSYSVIGEGETNEVSLLDPLNLVLCPHCNTKLEFKTKTITGQGLFNCTSCGLENTTGNLSIKDPILSSNKSDLTIEYNNTSYHATTKLVGLFNLYNFAAAAASLVSLKQDISKIIEHGTTVHGAFGRMEKLSVNDRTIILSLIKNPTGAKESLRTMFHDSFHNNVACFVLNDNFADGKDVSWIWDVPWETITNKLQGKVFVAGTRLYDMATRLQYAGVKQENIAVSENYQHLLDEIIKATKPQDTIPIFATYTAMIDLQKLFEKIGVKKKYWEE